ncbi:MAG: hypothetical protein A2Y34_00065 [Spirochaetes bacterium GWC1_27_15]|nr:MAG: hypothetical protein A2Z98_09845 [Spirochaetes bacterium GWB1_27_13]OHD25350.1 MAG: hypothetical protein A2Y34_00065 [Spirochaetes bacterium GWC1_27_15]
MSDPKNIFDYKEVCDRFMEEKELVKEVLLVYLQKTEKDIEKLASCIKINNFEEIRFIAHAIKGGSLNISAKNIGETAFNIEKEAKENSTTGVEKYFEIIKKDFEELKDAIKKEKDLN